MFFSALNLSCCFLFVYFMTFLCFIFVLKEYDKTPQDGCSIAEETEKLSLVSTSGPN